MLTAQYIDSVLSALLYEINQPSQTPYYIASIFIINILQIDRLNR